MNEVGSGFITIINYAAGADSFEEGFEILTENVFDILTESSKEMLTQAAP